MVADNQHVAAGQILVALDQRDMDAALAKARAAVAQADARVAVAQAQSDQAAATVIENQANLKQSEQDFARYHAINPGATTQQQIDAANAGIMSARAKEAASEAARAAAAASVIAARAQAQAARADVQNAELQVSYTIITAPCAGHVSLKTIEPGMVVAPGTAMMAVVGDAVWVTANYKETQLPGIKPGAKATIAIDAVPGIAFPAHVDSVQYGTGSVFSILPAQNATGNYIKIVQRVPVKLVFDDPQAAGRYGLSPGMSATPAITIGP
jgi:membrane fusion protein (multidrug efflux system)